MTDRVGIDSATLDAVSAKVGELGVSESVLSALRQTWPDVHFTYCSEDDIPARLNPAARGEGFGIYLVSGLQHCIGFTNQLEAATGLVIAADSED